MKYCPNCRDWRSVDYEERGAGTLEFWGGIVEESYKVEVCGACNSENLYPYDWCDECQEEIVGDKVAMINGRLYCLECAEKIIEIGTEG